MAHYRQRVHHYAPRLSEKPSDWVPFRHGRRAEHLETTFRGVAASLRAPGPTTRQSVRIRHAANAEDSGSRPSGDPSHDGCHAQECEHLFLGQSCKQPVEPTHSAGRHHPPYPVEEWQWCWHTRLPQSGRARQQPANQPSSVPAGILDSRSLYSFLPRGSTSTFGERGAWYLLHPAHASSGFWQPACGPAASATNPGSESGTVLSSAASQTSWEHLGADAS